MLSVDSDAWPEIMAHNRIDFPYEEGRRVFMVRIRAVNLGNVDSILGLSAEFWAVGASNEEVHYLDCDPDLLPDPLQVWAALPFRDATEGNICFDIAEEDADSLVLFADVGGYAGDPVRIWFSLGSPTACGHGRVHRDSGAHRWAGES